LPDESDVGKSGLGRLKDFKARISNGVPRLSGILRGSVMMRWLVIGLLVSVVALLLAAGGVVRHVWRHKRQLALDAADAKAQRAGNLELDRALDETPEPASIGPLDAPKRKVDPAERPVG